MVLRKCFKVTSVFHPFTIVIIVVIFTSVSISQTFDFDEGTVQSWTMEGMYAYDTYPDLYTNPFTLSWDDQTQYSGNPGDDPTGDNKGCISVYTSNLTLASNFSNTADYWLIDLVSPEVTSDQQWQNIQGFTVDIYADGFTYQEGTVQFLLNATRKSDNAEVWLVEVISGDNIFHALTSMHSKWRRINVSHFQNLSNYIINKVRIRIFGMTSMSESSSRQIYIDNVTPQTTAFDTELTGTVTAGSLGEGGNYLEINYESNFTSSHKLTHARIDFTDSNVEVGDDPVLIGPAPQSEIVDVEIGSSNRIIDIDFSNFITGKALYLAYDLDLHSTGSGAPTGSSYEGATVKITFDGVSQTCTMPLTGSFTDVGGFTAVADFSCDGTLPIPPAPTNLVANLIPEQIHITWKDNANDEDGFVLQKKYTPCLIYMNYWQTIDTLNADVTSYQTDAPALFNQTFYFRVMAYNEYGNSEYSNVDTVKSYLTLSSISISSPDGGEEWAPDSVHDITWSSFSSMPAYKINNVTIRYSIDGGSNWIDPPIASNIDNSGSYSWTVPDTESDNCIIKIEDASDGSPYDLNNSPFTIGEPVTPVLSVNPDTLDFDTSLDDLSFKIENTGGGTLTWSVSETPDKSWITSLDPSSGTGDDSVKVTIDRSQLGGNSGTGLLQITSNAGNREVTVLIKEQVAQLPGPWSFSEETGNNATIIVPTEANPTVEGTALENGDYIGVFTAQGLCCGYAQWQEENLSLTVWGDDPQTTNEIDGFQTGETINYRVYRMSEAKEWSTVTVSYSQGTGNYATDAFMVLSQFDATDAVEFTVDMAQGWNIFSINIDPMYSNVDSVMKAIKHKVVIMKDDAGDTYVPDYGINTIGNIDFRWGYKAYLNAAATLIVTGQAVDPAYPINLENGWSMISFLPDSSINAAEALTSISNELIIAKNGDGDTYVPAYSINTIGNMEPGEGYKVYLSAAATLVYPGESSPKIVPDLTAKKAVLSSDIDSTRHFQFTSKTGQNCIVVVPSSIEPQYGDGTLLKSGDEIGVFNSAGHCCGAIVWNEENTTLTVWGDNAQTADTVDGFLENDTLHFRIWDSTADVEYAALVNYKDQSDCVYHADGFGELTELIGEAGTGIENREVSTLPKEFLLKQNRPNPFNPETTIEFQLPEQAAVKLTVYDMTGREVCCLAQKTLSAGVHTAVWRGTDHNGHPMASGMYFYRIAANPIDGSGKPMIQVKKMIFMK